MLIRTRVLGLALAAAVCPAHAGVIMLSWDPVAGATGYRVYYGNQAGQYPQSVDAGNTTSATLTGLTDCVDWHLAVKAYNAAGESPSFSNEVVGWPRPEVGTPAPAAQIQGSQFTLEVTGSNFQPGATVEIDNPNVFLDAVAVLACDRIQIAATIEPTARGVRPAQVGRYTLSVVNPDTVYGARSQGFEVQINPQRFDLDDRAGPSQDRLDGRDTIWVSRLFASREGDPNYQPDSDFDGDGWVDGNDLAYIVSNLGRCWDGTQWNVAACPAQLQ
jgi:hypothetical protein